MPLTELATLGLESWCDFVLREVFNLLWHLWLCCLIVAQNLLFHLVASLGLGQPEHLHRHFLGHLRDRLPAMDSVINVFVSFVVFFLLYLSPSPFTFLALPPLIDIVPGEPTLGLPVISWFCTWPPYNKVFSNLLPIVDFEVHLDGACISWITSLSFLELTSISSCDQRDNMYYD